MLARIRRAQRTWPPGPPAPLLALFAVVLVACGGEVAARGVPAPTPSPNTRPSIPPSPSPLAQPTPLPVLTVVDDHIALTDTSTVHAGAPALAADSGILVDVDTHRILWERAPHLRHAPASLTKILTTLVALENFDLGRQVTITPDALNQQGDETRLGLHAGEVLTVQELVTAMLTVSANDAATAVAQDTVGLSTFVDTMNAQVEALDLHDSHFTTPVGLDDPQQYSSAYDLAVMTMAAYDHFSLVRQVTATREVLLPASPLHAAYDLHNINRLLITYPPTVGIKSGYTDNAGPCLITMAVRDHHRLLAVLLHTQKIFDDSRALLEWGFGQEGLAPLPLPSPSPSPIARAPLPRHP